MGEKKIAEKHSLEGVRSKEWYMQKKKTVLTVFNDSNNDRQAAKLNQVYKSLLFCQNKKHV